MSKKKKQKKDITQYENREPICPHFGICGGCVYQKISYDRQLEIKSKEVKALLDEVYNNYKFEGIIGSPLQEAYRNKMEFSFGDEHKEGPFALGLHKRGSFMDIVNITDCHIIHDDLNKIRNTIMNFFNIYYQTGQISFHNKKTHKGWLRHLLLRRAAKTGEIMVALVTDSDIKGGASKIFSMQESELLDRLKNEIIALKLEGEITGILHIINDSLSDIVQCDRMDILYGRDHIFDEVLGLRFKISAFSFFQTNTLGAEILYGKVREYAKNAYGTLFDLYSGTGTITQLMASVADEAVGVEIASEAVEAAKENAVLNNIDNVKFIAGDVLKVIDNMDAPDSLILDPPREGINPKALGKILAWEVEKIVYVSCKPTSLARDLESFKVAGYQLERACCVDMFPQVGHVETVVSLFQPPKKRDSIRIDVDVSEMEATITEIQHLATYDEIKKYCQEVHGVKVSTLFISQVKHFHELEMRRNYNTSKNSEYKRPKCPEDKFHAIEDALRYFKMI